MSSAPPTRHTARLVVLACVAFTAVACSSRDPSNSTTSTVGPRVASPASPPSPSTGPAEAPPPVLPPPPVSPTDPEATVMAADVPSLPSRAVCVEQPDGTFRSARVQASIAGVYDPRVALRLAHMNWMAPGVGCVSYPGASTRAVPCGSLGEPAAPVVSQVLCQQ